MLVLSSDSRCGAGRVEREPDAVVITCVIIAVKDEHHLFDSLICSRFFLAGKTRTHKCKDVESFVRLSLLAGSIEVQSALVHFVLTRQRGTRHNTSF